MILIDGYNLLHVTGLSGPEVSRREIGAGALERARNALLNFLASSLGDDERQQTIVAFDASNAPPGLPCESYHHGITVKYAAGYESADELLEELIREVSAPRRLTVVSSDHRVQRAAKRRKARAIDSDVWYAEICQSRQKTNEPVEVRSPKPTGPLSDQEIGAWLDEFGDICTEDLDSPAAGSTENPPISEPTATLPIENPFPPGYAEDLLD